MIYTKSLLLLADDCIRIVHGGRGDYVEISSEQIRKKSIKIPFKSLWRKKSKDVYYIEYRTTDDTNTMVYYQKRLVKYADYKIGFYYVYLEDVIIK